MKRLSLSEKLFQRKLGRVPSPGEIVVVELDLVYAHDGTFTLAYEVMSKVEQLRRIADPSKIALFIDHAAPAPTVAAAIVHQAMREFARKNGVRLYDVGVGISHQVVADEALIRPGYFVVGADSHTVTGGAFAAFATGIGSTDAAVAMATGKLWFRVPEPVAINLAGRPPAYIMGKDIVLNIIGSVGSDGMIYKAVEFQGDGLSYISMDSRMTISNMAVEMGAKVGLFPSDAITKSWFMREHEIRVEELAPDPQAEYSDELTYELERLEPMVAAPPNVDNVKVVSEVEGTEVDQVFIGSCTNGRYEDFIAAARILKGRKVKEGVRCIAIPASRKVYEKMLRNGIVNILLESGCYVAYGTCGPCIGAHLGILGENEVAISTTNRNFTGRMGHKTSKIYLASPATAAATAVEGKISDPRKYVKGEPLMAPNLA
ncbi:MAG: 3-isopropylmalate dehydratase large subunit [Hyperthermus sp.]|nr:MAG: 3-isopropylmalate dehydratase large subunit [Hyperthermus sp.]